jgi:parvulin-like peptidyl-prolyl isomerase
MIRPEKFRSFTAALQAVFLSLVMAAACSRSPSRGSEVVLAAVNDQKISMAEFDRYFRKNWPLSGEKNSVPPSLDIKLKFLNQLIEEKLILDEAERIGLEVSQAELVRGINEIKKDYSPDGFAKILIDNYIDYEEWKQSLGNQIILEKTIQVAVKDRVNVSGEEIKEYYNEYSATFERPQLLRIRQIVVDNKEEANEIRGGIARGQDFAGMAKKYSSAPEARNGGELGWVEKGQLLNELEKAAFKLKPGSVSKVLESPFGFHILKLEEKQPAKKQELDEVAQKIEGRIRIAKAEKVYRQWVNMLWERAAIQINYQLL